MDDVLSVADDRVGRITLNRPQAMNAVTVELGAQLEKAIRELARICRVIVIRGAGGNFSVGGDFHQLKELQARGREAMRPLFENFRAACGAIPEIDVPVVAVVEGYATAGGFELIQACDITLLHPGAKLADIHLRHGMVPGGGSTQRLPRLVGRQRAFGHILTGDVLTAQEAVDWGLAYRVLGEDTFEADVEAFLYRLAGRDEVALVTAKRLLVAAGQHSLSEGLDLEVESVLDHLSRDRSSSGIDEFVGGRRDGSGKTTTAKGQA